MECLPGSLACRGHCLPPPPPTGHAESEPSHQLRRPRAADAQPPVLPKGAPKGDLKMADNFADSDSSDEETSSSSSSSTSSSSCSESFEIRYSYSSDEDAARCAVCFKPASVPCKACLEEAYCSSYHREENMKEHEAVCAGRRRPRECLRPQVVQDGALATLPREVLLAVCGHLKAKALVRLGWVCSRLREVSRSAEAWQHVRFPDDHPFELSAFHLGALRIAPALGALELSEWPAVNLTRCTRRVQCLSLEDWACSMRDAEKVIRLLRHYKGHLQVLKLSHLSSEDYGDQNLQLLGALDGLGIKELYVNGNLLVVYPGSSKQVTALAVGGSVSGPVLADALRRCRKTLVSFAMSAYRVDKLSWACDRKGPVERALKKCKSLEELHVALWGRVGVLEAFPRLRSLGLIDAGWSAPHDAMLHFFQTSAVARGLESLQLHFECFAHRGLTQAAAAGCPNVKHLTLAYKGWHSMSKVMVDVPRDLHVLVGRMAGLESLVLSKARVPSSVFEGLAAGALPNLTLLDLRNCSVTEKGQEAVSRLEARRPEVRVLSRHLARAVRLSRKDHSYGTKTRCSHSACMPESDCEDRDPVRDKISSQDDFNYW
ncbi:uncharacterized protein LOC117654254 isoform X2 [Thrips palmi]|uniref:Uncharacterized protein LOC117654254 isoform X2 n=1 Tax=Thrips palmi TaxID=161013 RepID=A0A6P9AGT1_THRPL|nr:uncharacterized protein LOC117654254 isoform X2 [Thrips palmi]